MSIFIEMTSQNNQSQQELFRQIINQQLSQLINYPEFNSIRVADNFFHHQICFTIPRRQTIFLKGTKWTLSTHRTHLRIAASFINKQGLCYIRAQSERMKLQLMILLKIINSHLPISQQYFVNPKTGIVQYAYNIMINDYLVKLTKNNSLIKLFKYLFTQLNKYIEIIDFCEPSQIKSIQKKINKIGMEQVNRYRLLLKNTRQIRQNRIFYMKNIIQIRQQMKENLLNQKLRMQLDQIRLLFQNNIKQIQLLSFGVQQNKKNTSQLQDCVRHIHKNAQGSQSHKQEGPQYKNKNNRIVNGIIIYKSQSISIWSKGAHSEIFKGKFMYEIVKTVNISVLKANRAKWITGNTQKTQLILKKCKSQKISSRKSFINQLCLLNHLRDAQSKYIGKYYLELKNQSQRSQTDIIYMKPYSQNLYQLINNSRTLSMADRLTICYRISKGLCFLGSKNVLHRDFKPSNIMIDKLLNPFIIDFGSCAQIQNSQSFSVYEERLLTTKKFHINYDEIPQQYLYLHQKFTRDQYNFHPLFDVYSFGRIISYIFFNSITETNQDQISTKPYPQFLTNILFLIKLCLEVDPNQRPAIAQITSFLGTLKIYMDSLKCKFKNLSQQNDAYSQ